MKRKLKQELRNEIRRVLINLDARWIRAASAELCIHLNAFLKEHTAFEHVLAWVPSFPGEADLSSFIAAQLISDRTVYLPRVVEGRGMEFISIEEDWATKLEPGYAGIPEPAMGFGSEYDDTWAESTLVIAPGLAFDEVGGRLGRGQGHYDRFLSRVTNAGATTIGACWTVQFANRVPMDESDVKMDFVCHERGLVTCG